jgi:NitT/TauT family transport system permease protein
MSVDVTTTNNEVAATLPPTLDRSDRETSAARKAWSWGWPKVVAIGMVLAIWQGAVWAHWRPDYVLPGPGPVFQALWDNTRNGNTWAEVHTTLRRGLTGYFFAILIGTAIGIAVVQWRAIRLGVSSLIAGLQTMPSVAWFPLAILLFGLTESAVFFVVVLGAAPSIAAGVISGVDEVPPPLLRQGKMMGARGINRYRYIVLPAAMPSYVQGMRQGWAFSWRSLLAGELIVGALGQSLGRDMVLAQTAPNGAARVMSIMVVVLAVGMIVDGVFTYFTTRIREKRGLTGIG